MCQTLRRHIVDTMSAPPPAVDYSLIVCTYNRAWDLREMLETALALRTEGRFEYEIVVVDNNSSDNTRQVVEALLPRAHGRLRYLFEGRQGKSYALNTALEAVRGRIFSIADDDFLLPEDWLVRIDDAFGRDPDAAYVSGKVLPHWVERPPSWLTPEHWSALGLANYGDREFHAHRGNPLCLLACSFRVDAVRAVGGYDVRLGVSGDRTGGTEDSEIQERLWDAGRHGLYSPAMHFLHKVPPWRATKRYHRKWHLHHGGSHARMESDATSRSHSPQSPLPKYYLGEMLRSVLRSLRQRLSGDEAAAFRHEARAWFCAGYLAEWVARRRKSHGAVAVAR